MSLPPSEHIIWKLVEQALIGIVFALVSYFNYKNGLDVKDITTILSLWMTVAGFRIAKTKALSNEKEEPDNSPS